MTEKCFIHGLSTRLALKDSPLGNNTNVQILPVLGRLLARSTGPEELRLLVMSLETPKLPPRHLKPAAYHFFFSVTDSSPRSVIAFWCSQLS